MGHEIELLGELCRAAWESVAEFIAAAAGPDVHAGMVATVHTGFSAHNAVTVRAGDGDGLERLARYLLRPPLSLERLTLEPGLARYRHKRAHARRGEPFDRAELLARLVMHIPAPRLHLVRYYGHYSHVSRARRRRAENEVGSGVQAPLSSPEPRLAGSRPFRRRTFVCPVEAPRHAVRLNAMTAAGFW